MGETSSIRINQTGYASTLPVCAAVVSDEKIILTDGAGKIIKTVDPIAPGIDEASIYRNSPAIFVGAYFSSLCK